MEYQTPHFSIEKQADLLIQRGMNGNHDFIIRCLKQDNPHPPKKYCAAKPMVKAPGRVFGSQLNNPNPKHGHSI